MQMVAMTSRLFWPSESCSILVVCILPDTPYRPRKERHASSSRVKVGVFGYVCLKKSSTVALSSSRSTECW